MLTLLNRKLLIELVSVLFMYLYKRTIRKLSNGLMYLFKFVLKLGHS